MVKFVNCGTESFKEIIKKKDVIIYGAGRALETVIDRFFPDGSFAMLVDTDSKKTGRVISISDVNIMISSKNEMIDYVKYKNKADILLLITTPNYAAEIIRQLDNVPELDGIECYVHNTIRNTKEANTPILFSRGEQRIPKKIHYIWLGGKEIPADCKKYIEGWKKYNPDYDIVRWDETNLNLRKNDFIIEAYQKGALAWVSNYMRLDVIYNYGGIYFDTDVEVKKNLDCLLNDDAFFCMETTDSINNGPGFGAVKGNTLVKDMLSGYEGKHFDPDKGGVGLRPNHCFLETALIRHGFTITNRYQKHQGVVLYPKEVMSPLTIDGLPDFMTEYTLSIHHEKGSWKTKKEKDGANGLSQMIKTRMVNE